MQRLKIGLVVALISTLIAVFAMVGCNESKMNTGSNTLNSNISALNAKGGLQVSLNFIKKSMSTKASDISDVIDSVTFHITGTNLPAPINQIVQRADFKGQGWAVIQINDLLPGTINVTVEAKDASGNVIATGHQDNITVIPGDTIRIRIDCVINVGSVIIDFVCINCLPTPTVTIPASIEPPSPMPTVCCPVTPPPEKGTILVYVLNGPTWTTETFRETINTAINPTYKADYINQSDSEITHALIDDYKQVWLMFANEYSAAGELSPTEIDILKDYHNSKKGLLIAGDHVPYDAAINQLTNFWGVNYDSSIDRTALTDPIKTIPNHPIWSGITALIGHDTEAQMTVSPSGPASILGSYPENEPFIAILDETADQKGKIVFEASFTRLGYFGPTPVYIKNIANWLN